MKANELMIGDLVKLSKGNWSEIMSVNLIDIEMVAEGVYLAEPIPLTTEILEKNHFSRFAKVNWQYDTLSTFFLENPSNPNDYEDNYWLRVGNITTRIEYVHQLQHALRLCGIEKQIIL